MIRRFSPLFVVVLLSFCSCEKENWNLVDPPGGQDSILVRLVNFCSDGKSRSLSLDGKVTTTLTADLEASAVVAAVSDSAYLTVRTSTGEEYSISRRIRFSKQSTEIFVAVPSALNAASPKAIDTLIQLTTNRQKLTRSGYANLRLVVAGDDSTTSYEMRVGCPNGNVIGSGVPLRQSTIYNEVPAGAFVLSLLRNNSLVGIYRIDMSSGRNYTLIAAKRQSGIVVRVLDELNTSATAMSTPPTVSQNERVSFFRTLNYSASAIDSISTSGGLALAKNLQGRRCGSYEQVSACVSDVSDFFRLHSGGADRQNVLTSIGVFSRYTLVCYDSLHGGTAASALVLVPPLTTLPPPDSVTVRVVNCINKGINIRVRLGARTAANGSFNNGEVIAANTPAGTVSQPLRIIAGYAPITVVTSSTEHPEEQLIGSFVATVDRGKEYLFIVGDRSDSSGVEISMIEAGSENSTITSLNRGVFAQFVHARNDRAAFNMVLSGVITAANLTFTNSVATVIANGTYQLTAGSFSKSITVDTSRRMTVVIAGDAANADFIVLDLPSMRPTIDTARSRYLNVSKDVPSLRVSIDTVVDNGGSNIYADSLGYGVVSGIRSEVLPKRINFVFGNTLSLVQVYKPNYPLTLSTGKAYTMIFVGDAVSGYAAILQQEY